jgi:hypothetical protein
MTFATPTNLSNSANAESNPVIAAGGKNVYATWADSTSVYFQAVAVCQ